MKTMLQHCIHFLEQGESIVLVTVVVREGSAPRRTGARMIVRKNKKTFGSIGGGSLEAEICRQAEQVFEMQQPVISAFDLSKNTGRDMMFCGGRIEVLIDYADASDKKKHAAFHQALQALQSKRSAWLVTAIPDEKKSLPNGIVCLDAAGKVLGGFDLFPELKERVLRCRDERSPWLLAVENKRFFVEPLFGLPKVFIFGSGHIAQQLAVLAVTAGFRTTVLDDRRKYLVRQNFPLVDELVLLAVYTEAFADISVDEDSYLIVLTRNAALDKQVLTKALKTDAAYIGMIGSRQKCQTLCDEMKQMGLEGEDMDRIHAPIGLDIGAETPEEVAISIVTQLIQQRSRFCRHFKAGGKKRKIHAA